MENIKKIKHQIKTDKDLPTVLKGIHIEEYNNSNIITTKVAHLNKDSNDVFNLILAFNKPISKCL
jgi:hypothetical protein